MIHLMTAHYYRPDAPGSFLLGCFAPDFTNDRLRKDTIHLRLEEDRWSALMDMSEKIDPADDFMEGWLFHLFTDACWDEGPQKTYREANSDWFIPYRNEIGLATYHIFHREPWVREVWRKVMSAPLQAASVPLGATAEEVGWYRDRVDKKHSESADTPSTAFPPDMICVFAEKTAREYGLWRRV